MALNINPVYKTPNGIKISKDKNGNIKQGNIFVKKSVIIDNNIVDGDNLYVYLELDHQKIQNLKKYIKSIFNEDELAEQLFGRIKLNYQ